MTEFLIVRFDPAAGDRVDWVVVNELGAQLTPPDGGAMVDIAEMAPGRKVIGIVPANDVLRTAIDLPVKGAAKQLQALPFAMEEQLADDVDDLHFAIGKRKPDGLVPVAVTRREHIERWLDQFHRAGIEPAGLCTEGDAIGDIPGTALLLIEREHSILRAADGGVTFIDSDNLRDDARALARETGSACRRMSETGARPPVNLLVYVSGDDISRHDQADRLAAHAGFLDRRPPPARRSAAAHGRPACDEPRRQPPAGRLRAAFQPGRALAGVACGSGAARRGSWSHGFP